jgi:hypothetical protein
MPRARVLAGWVLAVVVVAAFSVAPRGGLLTPSASAQNIQGMRTVKGAVVSADSNPVPAATVFLENQKSKSIRSYTSDSKGHFNFAQVTMVDDYDIWAEKDGKKSATKTVSSWDARAEFVTDLKLK